MFSSSYGQAAGVLLATLAVQLGAMAGGAAAFLAGRFLLRGFVAGLARRYVVVRALDGAMREQGLRILCLLWLSPILPWNILNWLLAGTALPFRSFCLGWAAMLPETLLWCYLGSLLQSLADATSGGGTQPPALRYGLLGAGAACAAATLWVLTWFAKKRIKEIVAAQGGGGATV